MTDQNPLQVAVDAIVNCGPRESREMDWFTRRRGDTSTARMALVFDISENVEFFLHNSTFSLISNTNAILAVDVSPLRRVNQSISLLTIGPGDGRYPGYRYGWSPHGDRS
jgi:small subunit ribosomal protein S5e